MISSSPPAMDPAGDQQRFAVLIDFGGVLTVPLRQAFGALSQDLGVDADQALSVLATHEGARLALGEHEVGRLDDEAFEDAFAAALSEVGDRQVEPRGLLKKLGRHMDLDEAMVDLVRELRAAGVPVALVSNSLGRDSYARIDVDELFDVAVISGQVGIRKPSRRIYAIACERLGVRPEDCILIDDLEHNLVGAARLGIEGIHHHRADETIVRVRRALGLVDTTPTT